MAQLDMNQRLSSALQQLRDMKLSPAELEGLHARMKGRGDIASTIIATAAEMLLLEIAFSSTSN